MIFRLFFLFFLLAPYSVPAQELSIYTEELPPLNYLEEKTGQAEGFSVSLVKELLARTGIKPAGGKIMVYPWARSMKIVEKEPNTMLFSMTRTGQRQNLFKWVGPIAPRTVWLWKLKDRTDVSVSSLEDAKKYRIGGVYKFAISEHLQGQGFPVDMANDIDQNWKKLLARRIDLGTATELEAAYYLKKMGLKPDILEKIIKIDDRYQFFIALSKGTADELVARLQTALDNMKSDGSYDRLKKIWTQ